MAAGKRYLVLGNGRAFEGFAFGADVAAVGEVVFATNMSGFAQGVTDPGFSGQLVVQTFPLVGNTGLDSAQIKSPAHLAGYIVREWCQSPSHHTCAGTLDAFLLERNIPGLWGVDTRALTKLIRSEGAMNGMITDDPARVDIEALKAYEAGDAVSRVSVKEPEQYSCQLSTALPSVVSASLNCQLKVVLWDFGRKQSTIDCLNSRGCDVLAVPHTWTAAQIRNENPDGIVLSGGPGNPALYTGIVNEITQLLDKGIPIFGIALGHQLLALANGGATEKLRYGHRGGCSVKEIATGRTLVTSQNHGYAVSMDRMPQNAKVSYVNANDHTCEGLDYTDFGGFSAQFAPEDCWTPHSEGNLFDRFIADMQRRAA